MISEAEHQDMAGSPCALLACYMNIFVTTYDESPLDL